MCSLTDYLRIQVTAEKALLSREQVQKIIRYVTDEIKNLYAISLLDTIQKGQ